MKKFLFLFLSGFLLTFVSQAQKFGYIDSNFILSKMPAFTKVQQELDKQAEVWQRDIENMHQGVEKLKQEYKAEEVLLTEEMKQKRQSDIAKKEAEARDYQRKVFGYEGMMFKRRQELIKPIQDQVFEAIEKVAKSRQLAIMFDKSGDLVMIYTNPVHDYTEYVLEELGLGSGNAPGKKPVQSIVDDPDDLPITGGEQQDNRNASKQ
ncbi:OmpH family outer membrane protein [Pontibacter harenae]|uniref:OmpH family outer membrane protein n=1 Tax=Pontibacter harenae TaxID=2894083 RepID=UPI001E595140|nr:OmpH family outer membrane protein [Pontibacter harenae]MCC9168664.1 OmpH family outer membrane protein [Pontibacter harenae]